MNLLTHSVSIFPVLHKPVWKWQESEKVLLLMEYLPNRHSLRPDGPCYSQLNGVSKQMERGRSCEPSTRPTFKPISAIPHGNAEKDPTDQFNQCKRFLYFSKLGHSLSARTKTYRNPKITTPMQANGMGS